MKINYVEMPQSVRARPITLAATFFLPNGILPSGLAKGNGDL
jgi:hypothetical protein